MELLKSYRNASDQEKIVRRILLPPYRISGKNELSTATSENPNNPLDDINMTEFQQQFDSVQKTSFLAPIAAFEHMGNASQQRQVQIIYKELVNNFKFILDKDLTPLKSFPVHCFIYDENTIGIEWNLNKMIITFDIEEEPEESCWSITSVQSAGGYNDGDYFHSGKNVASVTKKIADMVIQQFIYF